MYPPKRIEGAVDGSGGLGRLEEVLQEEGTIKWSDWKRQNAKDIASKGFPLKSSQVIFGYPRRFGSKHGGLEIL